MRLYNRPASGAAYAPVTQRLLPLDESWHRRLVKLPWPTAALPEVIGDHTQTLRALIREYLFVSLFRACAESLASENASRLAAMQRADKNIDDLLETLNGTFHRLRQSGIDAELFDVTAGFEALSTDRDSAGEPPAVSVESEDRREGQFDRHHVNQREKQGAARQSELHARQ
jgi:F-type H+-transporting ATPase subunit gamma